MPGHGGSSGSDRFPDPDVAIGRFIGDVVIKMTARRQVITVLGSTGSIGVSTLDVLSRHPDQYSVYALTANRHVSQLLEQCEKFHPEVAVVGTAESALLLQNSLRSKGVKTEVLYGEKALCQVAASEKCDAVMAAIVGAAGLAPALAAARAGKKVMLANQGGAGDVRPAVYRRCHQS